MFVDLWRHLLLSYRSGEDAFTSGFLWVEKGCSQSPAMLRAAPSTHTHWGSWFMREVGMSLGNPLIAPHLPLYPYHLPDSSCFRLFLLNLPFISVPIYLPSLLHVHLLDPVSLRTPPILVWSPPWGLSLPFHLCFRGLVQQPPYLSAVLE